MRAVPAQPAQFLGGGRGGGRVPTIDLADRYQATDGSVLLTGVQALVRLLFDQVRADRAAGLNTAAFVSGYQGSPLGTFDLTLARTGSLLGEYDVTLLPGVNEDIAATSVWAASRATSRRPLAPAAGSGCGTARARASTAAGTRSGTPTCTAPAATAAWSRPRATTRPRSPRRCRTAQRWRCTTPVCRCSLPARRRRCSTSAGTATSCRDSPD